MIRHTTSVEVAAKLCGISRGVAYEQARRPGGAIPSVRVGRRLVVPVARLAETLGTSPEALSRSIEVIEAGDPTSTEPPQTSEMERR
jgi:hypothetical protein